jgi:hypothetical protein
LIDDSEPDELKYQREMEKKAPSGAFAAIEEIEVHLRYGIPSMKLIGWIIVFLLTLILWRVW